MQDEDTGVRNTAEFQALAWIGATRRDAYWARDVIVSYVFSVVFRLLIAFRRG